MQAPPFFVKLVKPGASFSDPVTKFHIHSDQIKEVTTLSPLLKSWIQNGGLVVTDEDGNVDEAVFRSAPKSVTKTLGLGQKPSQPAKTTSKSGKGATGATGPATPAGDKESTGADALADDGHEKTLEELMAEGK